MNVLASSLHNGPMSTEIEAHARQERGLSASRMEAYSDGVIAVIITIMVLELKTPKEPTLQALCAEYPVFLSYVLSFVNVGIYWNNHHHLIRAGRQISGSVMWANLNLLFWLSLIPFFTSWFGAQPQEIWPTFCYACDLLLCGSAYWVLQSTLIRSQGPHSELERRLGRDLKGKLSVGIYACALGLTFISPYFADAAFVCVALMWFIPDRRLV